MRCCQEGRTLGARRQCSSPYTRTSNNASGLPGSNPEGRDFRGRISALLVACLVRLNGAPHALNCAPGNPVAPVNDYEIGSRVFELASILAIAVAALAAPGLAAGADYKIGFVNSERVFRDAAPAKRAQQKIEKEFAGRDAEIQKLSGRVRDLQTNLEKDGVTMAETERRNKERDLANMTRDLQRLQREFREDLNLRKNEELFAVQERANKVILQIAADEKFDLMIQDPVIYASPRIDITDRVIKALADK